VIANFFPAQLDNSGNASGFEIGFALRRDEQDISHAGGGAV